MRLKINHQPFRPTRYYLLTGILLLNIGNFGCSSTNRDGEDRPQLTKRGIGVATGAVLGASLGAIIGSESGHVGEGVAVGGLAGAAAGGLIAGEVDKQDTSLREQNDALSHQQESIHGQQQEIQKLRETAGDDYSKSSAIPWEIAQHRPPQHSYPTEKYARVANQDSTRAIHSRSQLQGYRSASVPSPAVSAPKKTSLSPSPAEQSAKPSPVPTPSEAKLPPANLPDLSPENDEVEEIDTSSDELSTGEDVQEATLMPLNPGKGEDCAKAETEAKQAEEATSNADRLFYLRRALRLCPKNGDYHLQVGRIYLEIGRKEDAQFEFQQAAELNPENSAALEELSKLEGTVTQ